MSCFDSHRHRFIGEGYFCNFDKLPGVVACCMKVNPSLNESCYNPNTLFLLDSIKEAYETGNGTYEIDSISAEKPKNSDGDEEPRKKLIRK